MRIKIIYSGRLSKVTQKKIEFIEVIQGTTVKQLIELLCESYGAEFEKTIISENNVELRIPVFINAVRKDMKDVIHDGDTLLFSRIVIGG